MSDGNQGQEQTPDSTQALEAELVPSRPPGPGFWGSVGCCLLMMAAQFVVGTLAVVAFLIPMIVRGQKDLDPQRLEDSLPIVLVVGAAVAGTLLCALTIVAIAYGRRAPRLLALRSPTVLQWILVLLAVLPLSVLASEVTNWVALVAPRFEAAALFARFAQESLAAALVFGALLAAVGEELCFRGFIGRGLVARYGPLTGILLTSLLFGLVHLEPVQASGAMLLGVGIHGIYLATRSLYAPFAVHLLNNALAFTAFSFQDRLRLPGYIPGEEAAPEFTPWPLLLAAAAAVGGLALVFWETRTRFLFANGCPWDPGYKTAEQPPAGIEAAPHCAPPRLASLIAMAVLQAAFVAALLAYADWM